MCVCACACVCVIARTCVRACVSCTQRAPPPPLHVHGRGWELEGAEGEFHVRADGPDDGRYFFQGDLVWLKPYQKANPFSNKKKKTLLIFLLFSIFFYIYI